jgi:hypothetical protein
MKTFDSSYLLLAILQSQSQIPDYSQLGNREWQEFLETARQAGLLARLAVRFEEIGAQEKVPNKALILLEEALTYVRHNQTLIRYEVDRVTKTLSGNDIPIILLKGGAYLMAGLPPHYGRSASDLDILVPRKQLETAQQALLEAGWEQASLTEYDEHYYRKWMHEIPAMWHPERRVVVDIHHTIAPISGHFRPNARALIDAAVDIGDRGLKVLCPADMVLHATIHLFNEDFSAGLRDLTDLHDLLGHFGQQDRFWDELLIRSRLHGLERPLYYLLRNSKRLLSTAIPPDIERAAQVGAPPPIVRHFMDLLNVLALTPPSGENSGWRRGLALWLLYLRSHWLKMPPPLLARHLCIKAFHRWGKGTLPHKSAQANSR